MSNAPLIAPVVSNASSAAIFQIVPLFSEGPKQVLISVSYGDNPSLNTRSLFGTAVLPSTRFQTVLFRLIGVSTGQPILVISKHYLKNSPEPLVICSFPDDHVHLPVILDLEGVLEEIERYVKSLKLYRSHLALQLQEETKDEPTDAETRKVKKQRIKVVPFETTWKQEGIKYLELGSLSLTPKELVAVRNSTTSFICSRSTYEQISAEVSEQLSKTLVSPVVGVCDNLHYACIQDNIFLLSYSNIAPVALELIPYEKIQKSS